MCSSLNCHCVSSYLETVEKGLIEKLSVELEQRKYFLDKIPNFKNKIFYNTPKSFLWSVFIFYVCYMYLEK